MRTLGGTTALLLLCVFALVNVAVLVLRARPVAHAHFRAPTLCPILGLVSCLYLASPLAHFVNGSMIEIDGGQQKPLMDAARDAR